MKLAKCKKCASQFDVSSMESGTTFICGKCGDPVEVPAAGDPVLQPIKPKGHTEMPATVVLTADQMKQALKDSHEVKQSQAPAQKKALPKLPKAMQKRAQQDGTSQTRAGGAAKPKQPAKPAGPKRMKARASAARTGSAPPAKRTQKKSSGGGTRTKDKPAARSSSRSSARPAREEPAKKKPNVGLFVGIGAVALIAIVGGVMMMGGKKGGDTPPVTDPGTVDTAGTTPGTDGTTATTQPAGGATPVAEVPKDEWETFAALTPDQQWDDALKRLQAAKDDAVQLKALYDWFSHGKLTRVVKAREAAKMAATAAKKTSPVPDWALTALGQINGKAFMEKVRSECEAAFGVPTEAENAFNEALDELDKEPWVDAAGMKRLEGVAAKVRERQKMIDEDPRWLQVSKIEADLKESSPAFKGLKFTRHFAPPYVIFQEYPEILGEDGEPDPSKAHVNKQRLRKAKILAEREGIIFNTLNKRFLELFGDRFDLHGKLEKHDRLMVCVMLWNQEKFMLWNSANGPGVGFGVRAFYSPSQQIIVHYVGDDAMRGQDEIRCKPQRPDGTYNVQKLSDQVTFHEGTHQLMHEYSSIYTGSPLKWGTVQVRSGRTMWFDEGLAEFMGAVEINSDAVDDLSKAKWEYNRLLLERTKLIRAAPRFRPMAEKWTIPELLLPDSNKTMAEASERLTDKTDTQLMINVFYARGWGLVHFLYNYNEGQYRSKFLDYMEHVMKGTFGPESMANTFGRPNASDWGGMDKEFNWYWNEMINRRVGEKKDKQSGQTLGWWYADTEPPKGPAQEEDDGGFDLGDDDDDEEDEDE